MVVNYASSSVIYDRSNVYSTGPGVYAIKHYGLVIYGKWTNFAEACVF